MMLALTSRWGSRSCLRRRETASLRELHTYELKFDSMTVYFLLMIITKVQLTRQKEYSAMVMVMTRKLVIAVSLLVSEPTESDIVT